MSGLFKNTSGIASEPIGRVQQPLFDDDVAVTAVKALRSAIGNTGIGEDRVRELIAEAIASVKAPVINLTEINIGQPEPIRTEPNDHQAVGALVSLLCATRHDGLRFNALLVGPAGSGKTTIASRAAELLGVEFGAISLSGGTSESDFVGYMNATGSYTERSSFVRLYGNGGLFLFDELDACDENVCVRLNASLSNGHLDLPNGARIARHPEFRAVAAANTYGHGADRLYVGRNQLDAATLDRFVGTTLFVDYDEALETRIGNAELVAWCHELRRRVAAGKVRRIVSTRAILTGTSLIAQGIRTLDTHRASVLQSWSDDELRTARVTREGGLL